MSNQGREADVLEAFERKKAELLQALKGKRLSGRLVLYLDVKGGTVVNCGEIKEQDERWA